MAKKGKKSKSKKESKEKLVATSPVVDSNDKAYSSEGDNEDFDKILEEFADKQLVEDKDPISADDEDFDSIALEDIPDSPNFICPQFTNIVHSFLSKDWKLDYRESYKNFLHILKDGERFMLYTFYGSKECESNVWLADEEKFNDEEPLWFCKDSHVVSPLYIIKV